MSHRFLKTGARELLGFICAACMCFFILWLSPSQARGQADTPLPETVTITSLGMGPPQIDAAPEDHAAKASLTAVDDARRRSVVLYLIETLGIAEYDRLERGVESLILTNYEDYIIDSTMLTEDHIHLSTDVIVTVRVTLDSAALLSYMENIARLAPPVEEASGPSEDEMNAFASRAEKTLLQADVATDVLLDPIQGIESYESAMSLFETARDEEGVYRCLMGIGRAKASLGHLAEAEDFFVRAGDVARSLGNTRDEEASRLERAWLKLLTGDYTGACDDISALLEDIRGAGFDDIEARALEILSQADFALDRRERALDEIVRAIFIYERLGDKKSHYAAYVSYGLMLLTAGEIDAAVEELKYAKIMSERMEDSERRAVVLTALGSAFFSLGDYEGALLYLDEAVTTAVHAGWDYGAARGLIERAKIFITIEDISRAASDAARAEELAKTLDVPSLSAASLFVRGRIAELQNDRAGALDAYLGAAAEASDIRVTAVREPYAPFTTSEMKTCVEAALGLAAGMDDTKSATEAVSYYHSALTNRYLFIETSNDFSLPPREPVSVSEWKAVVGRTLGIDAVWKSPATNAFSNESLDTLTERREQALDEFFKSAAVIKKQAPVLALLSGIDHPNYLYLRQLLGPGCAHVQYFVGPSRAFALVVTTNDFEIVTLPTGSADIIEATEDLLAAMEEEETVSPIPAITPDEAPEGTAFIDTAGTDSDEETAPVSVPDILTFEEAARRASALVISPISSYCADADTIGINPGPDLPGLALAALTDGTGFLPTSAAVFHCPAAFRRYFTPTVPFPTLTYLVLLGRGRIDMHTHEGLFYDTSLSDSLENGLMMLPDETVTDSDFVLVFNEKGERPVVIHPAALTLFSYPPGDDPASMFCALELFYATGPECGAIILPQADPDTADIFFRELILGVREYGMPKGFEKALESDNISGRAATAQYLLFGDF
ncbi:MAG: tetratricopeptide repeat protein [Deltaproteobacteria bacterium]|nr:tetratricopeptide repeat protein [Candidatus Zymogenaceae bacterium]